MRPDAPPTAPRLVPRDAATLLLLDRTPGGVHVLMGRRRDDLAFNPGATVFPGGRVDPVDGVVPAAVELTDRQRERLLDRMRRSPSRRRARGLVAAAIRETAEETGYLLGLRRESGRDSPLPPAYAQFDAGSVDLDLSSLVLVGRAITPVDRPRRFDARFFAAFAEDVVAAEPTSPVPPDNELADVRFVPLSATDGLSLPRITAVMLRELGERLAADSALTRDLPAPFYLPVGKQFRRELI